MLSSILRRKRRAALLIGFDPYEDGDRSKIDGFTSCSNLGSNGTELDSLNHVAVYSSENALPKSNG
jgi:hypothetical protein